MEDKGGSYLHNVIFKVLEKGTSLNRFVEMHMRARDLMCLAVRRVRFHGPACGLSNCVSCSRLGLNPSSATYCVTVGEFQPHHQIVLKIYWTNIYFKYTKDSA